MAPPPFNSDHQKEQKQQKELNAETVFAQVQILHLLIFLLLEDFSQDGSEPPEYVR